jgi:hypothetical protein
MHRSPSLVVGFIALAMAIAAPAVVQAQSRVAADVPFAFIMNDQSLASGHYEVASRSEQLAIIRNTQSGVGYFLIKSQHVESRYAEGAKLVFNRYGNVYFLSQIWDGQSNTGIQLPRSKREKEARLAESRFSSGPEVVIVAMK